MDTEAGKRAWVGLAVLALPTLLVLDRRDGAPARLRIFLECHPRAPP
jgi:hypothetical protein